MSLVQSLAWRHFTKKHSLSLRPEVVDFLTERLAVVPDEQVGQVIEYIATAYVRQVAASGAAVVELSVLEEIIGKLFRSHRVQTEAVSPKDYVHVIDGTVPALCYDQYTQSFTYTPNVTTKERHDLLLERVQRHQRDHQVEWKLSPVKSLKVRDCMEDVYCFGMVYKSLEGEQYVLEDPDDQIIIEVDSQTSLLIDGQFVVAHGSVSDSAVFRVSEFYTVPLDTRRSLLKMAGFPCPLKTIAKETEHVKTLRELEARCGDAWLACFSELWLDRDDHLVDFDKALQSMTSTVGAPTILVLLGSFHSNPPNIYANPTRCLEEYQRLFKRLDAVLLKHPQIVQECKIVLAPGPTDPFTAPNLTPRHKLPSILRTAFSQHIDVVFSDDPVRIFWFSKELVFTRDDLTSKLEKARLFNDASIGTVKSAETAISNGTLQPCTSEYQAVRVQDAGRLSLCPPPDLLVVAEKANAESSGSVLETAVGNPERFAYTRSFLTYSLAEGQAKVLSL